MKGILLFPVLLIFLFGTPAYADWQKGVGRPMNRISNQILIVVTIILLSACAITVPGPKFTELAAPIEDKGDVYLYRTATHNYSATSTSVKVDGEKVDSLSSASFLHLRLSPGEHTLSVHPSGIFLIELTIMVEAGKTKFFQYYFPTSNNFDLLTTDIFYLFSTGYIRPIEQPQALQDLKELYSAKE